MATGVLQFRRGPTASRLLVTPADGEIFVDTDTYKVYIGDGTTAGGIQIGLGAGGFTTVTKTVNYSLISDDNGLRFDNIGAGGAVDLGLVAAVANFQVGGAVFAAQYLKFVANGSDVISIGSDSSVGGGYIRSNVPYSSIVLEAHSSGRWIASSFVGSWSIDS